MARTLLERGHEVTLFAGAGSDPELNAELLLPEEFCGSETGRRDISAKPEEWMQQHHAYLGLMLRLAQEFQQTGRPRFDVIHNNSLHHLPVAMSSLVPTPIITTLHTPPTPWLESAISYAGPEATFAAVSRATAEAWSDVVSAEVVTNGVDIQRWSPGPGGTEAVWTGRLVPEKAPHLAIDAARLAGFRIHLAGPVMDQDYFTTEVLPRLDDTAIYRGHLHQDELRELVGGSAVAVVSSQWDEPYGLVAAEAMACGTPVAAFPRGGLVENVSATSGVLAAENTAEALADAIRQAAELDRSGVRAWAEKSLSLERMVRDYEMLYDRAAHPHGAGQAQTARAAA